MCIYINVNIYIYSYIYIYIDGYLSSTYLIVNPTYLIGSCDCTLFSLVLKTISLIFDRTQRWIVANIGTACSDIIDDT